LNGSLGLKTFTHLKKREQVPDRVAFFLAKGMTATTKAQERHPTVVKRSPTFNLPSLQELKPIVVLNSIAKKATMG